jgi:Cu+-exporting ATPase
VATNQRWLIPEEKSVEEYLSSMIFSVEKLSTHSISQAVVRHFESTATLLKTEQLETLSGFGVSAVVDGFKLFIGSEKLMRHEEIKIPDELSGCLKDSDSKETHSFVAVNGICVAAFCLADKIREGAIEVISYLKEQGITPVMMTGDNATTAKAVAKEVNIEKVFSDVPPQEKEKYIRELKKGAVLVGMVGDGINDAPALARADVGIAMSGGTDVAMETAGIILLHSDIKLIPEVIKISRATMRNITQNLIWAFGYNIILIPVAMGVFYPWWGITVNPILAAAAMALSSVSVVLNALRLQRMRL